MTIVPGSGSSAGATNPPNPGETATPSGNDGSGDLSPETVAALLALARVIDPDACDPPVKAVPIGVAADVWRRQDEALRMAYRVWDAGFRAVVDDDTTVDRVAESMWREFWREVPGYGITKEFWRGPARAAVRALREGSGQ